MTWKLGETIDAVNAGENPIMPMDTPERKERFVALKHPNPDNEYSYYMLVESGIFYQLKCSNPMCKYVRYGSL